VHADHAILSPTKCTVLFSDILYYSTCKPVQHVLIPHGIITGNSYDSKITQDGTNNVCSYQKDGPIKCIKDGSVKLLAISWWITSLLTFICIPDGNPVRYRNMLDWFTDIVIYRIFENNTVHFVGLSIV
jgi:hypothetical protein